MKYSIDDLLKSPFEKIKRMSDDGYEYCSTRDLYKLLDYSEYRHFCPVIDKVKEALINLNELAENHVEDTLDMVKIGSGAKRQNIETKKRTNSIKVDSRLVLLYLRDDSSSSVPLLTVDTSVL